MSGIDNSKRKLKYKAANVNDSSVKYAMESF